MIRTGSTVRVARIPENNAYWCISEDLINRIGIVSNIDAERLTDGGRIYVIIGRDEWYFPYNQTGVLELSNEHRWNTLGYVSPFKPLNLP